MRALLALWLCLLLAALRSARELVPLKQVPDHRPWTSERWLRRMVFERRMPYHKVGSRILIDLADLDALAEQGRCEPDAAAEGRS